MYQYKVSLMMKAEGVQDRVPELVAMAHPTLERQDIILEPGMCSEKQPPC